MALQLDKTKTFLFQDGLDLGEAKGKAEGEVRGRDEQLIEIVKEMYAADEPLAKIARFCRISEERVRAILGFIND